MEWISVEDKLPKKDGNSSIICFINKLKIGNMKNTNILLAAITLFLFAYIIVYLSFDYIFDNYGDFEISIDDIDPDTGEKTFYIDSTFWIDGEIVYSEFYYNIPENKIDSIRNIHEDVVAKFKKLKNK